MFGCLVLIFLLVFVGLIFIVDCSCLEANCRTSFSYHLTFFVPPALKLSFADRVWPLTEPEEFTYWLHFLSWLEIPVLVPQFCHVYVQPSVVTDMEKTDFAFLSAPHLCRQGCTVQGKPGLAAAAYPHFTHHSNLSCWLETAYLHS